VQLIKSNDDPGVGMSITLSSSQRACGAWNLTGDGIDIPDTGLHFASHNRPDNCIISCAGDQWQR
jgi:hypothetical protein